ncbi:hypothetical protein BVX98_05135 [bacterium F11]|nr:hypothetical protein BVX98_05135 [bacterium F11]
MADELYLKHNERRKNQLLKEFQDVANWITEKNFENSYKVEKFYEYKPDEESFSVDLAIPGLDLSDEIIQMESDCFSVTVLPEEIQSLSRDMGKLGGKMSIYQRKNGGTHFKFKFSTDEKFVGLVEQDWKNGDFCILGKR